MYNACYRNRPWNCNSWIWNYRLYKNKYSIVDYGVILTSKDLSNEERLEIVYNELNKILKKI